MSVDSNGNIVWTTPTSGLTNYDFTISHKGDTSGLAIVTCNYLANTRGYFDITTSNTILVMFNCYNNSENYLLVKNTGASDITVVIAGVTYNGTSVTKIVVPSDGISVKAGSILKYRFWQWIAHWPLLRHQRH